MSPQVLNLILKALEANGEVVFARDDIATWPEGDFDEALRAGLLVETEPAKEVVCPGCEEACLEDVEFVCGDEGEAPRAYVVCGKRDDIGRVEIPLEQLQRWAVNATRVKELRPRLMTDEEVQRFFERPERKASPLAFQPSIELLDKTGCPPDPAIRRQIAEDHDRRRSAAIRNYSRAIEKDAKTSPLQPTPFVSDVTTKRTKAFLTELAAVHEETEREILRHDERPEAPSELAKWRELGLFEGFEYAKTRESAQIKWPEEEEDRQDVEARFRYAMKEIGGEEWGTRGFNYSETVGRLHAAVRGDATATKPGSLPPGPEAGSEVPKREVGKKARMLTIEEVAETLHWKTKTIQNWNDKAKKAPAFNDYWRDVLVLDGKTQRVLGYDAEKFEDWRSRRRPSVVKVSGGPAIEENLSPVEKDDGRACDDCNRKPVGNERFAVAMVPDNPGDPNSTETKVVICPGCYKEKDERYKKIIRENFDTRAGGKPPSWLK